MKYPFLRFLGIPNDLLGFAYVVTAKGERHMVLFYQTGKGQHPLVLKNMTPAIQTSKKRQDLTAVYIFQNDDQLFVVKGIC